MSKLDARAKAGLFYLLLVAFTVPVSVALVAFSLTNNAGRGVNAQVRSANICDFNRDGRIDKEDSLYVTKGFGQNTQTSGYGRYDVDHDGLITFKDINAVASADPKFCTE